MKVEVIDGNVYCISDNWKNLSEVEHKFLSSCAYESIWNGFDELGRLRLNQSVSTFWKKQKLSKAVYYCKYYGIEYDNNITLIIGNLEAELEEEYQRERLKAEYEKKKTIWEYRKENGCDGCSHYRRIGDDWGFCKYSGEELDTKFYPKYNPKTQSVEMFYEVGIPTEKCKDYA